MSVASLSYAELGYAAQERRDWAAAQRIYQRGAADGCSISAHGLAYMFDSGLGVEVDKAEAMRLYRRAWRIDKSAGAGNNIAILYREAGNRRAMFKWFCRTAEAGEDGDAWLEMAKCYLGGLGVRRSVDEAMRCLAKVGTTDYVTEASQEEAASLLAELSPRLVQSLSTD